MKRNIVAISLFTSALVLHGFLYSSEEFVFTPAGSSQTPTAPVLPNADKATAPSTYIKAPARLNRWNIPGKVWRLLWPAKTTVATQNRETFSLNEYVEKEVAKIFSFENKTHKIFNSIDVNAQAKSNRLLLGACGYAVLRGLRTIDHSLPVTQGISRLLQQSVNIKTLGLVAGLGIMTKVVAPWAIRSWQKRSVAKTFKNHEATLSKLIAQRCDNTANFKQYLLGKYSADATLARSIIERIIPEASPTK